MLRLLALIVALALSVDQGSIIRLRRVAPDPPTITWTEQSLPGDAPSLMHFTDLRYNPVASKVIGWLNPTAASSIYASALHHYAANTNDWTFIGGSTPTGNDCTSHLSASPTPWPQDRHPIGNFLIDTARDRGVLLDGVCATDEQNDMWFLDLNALTWTQALAEDTTDTPFAGGAVYVSDYDLYIAIGMTASGNFEAWVYAPSASVNANQIAAGATSAQTWFRTHGPGLGSGLPSYPAMWNNSVFWDTFINRLVLFAKDEDSGNRELWWYDPLTKTWSLRSSTTGVPTDMASLSTGDKDHVLITSGELAGQYLFHLTTRTGACNGAQADHLYNPQTEAYRPITTVGTGPGCAAHLAWDESATKVVARGGATGTYKMFTAVISQ